MPNLAHQPDTFKTGPLMAVVVAACVVGGSLGLGAAIVGKWHTDDFQAVAVSVFVSAGVWLLGGVLGVLLLSVNTQNHTSKLAQGVLASSTARMLVALFVGVLLYFLLSLEGRCFWTTFLLAGLLSLVAETIWAIRTINTARHRAAEAGVS